MLDVEELKDAINYAMYTHPGGAPRTAFGEVDVYEDDPNAITVEFSGSNEMGEDVWESFSVEKDLDLSRALVDKATVMYRDNNQDILGE